MVYLNYLSAAHTERHATKKSTKTPDKNNIVIIHFNTSIIHEHLTYKNNRVIHLQSLTHSTSEPNLPPILGQPPTILVGGDSIHF